MRWSFLFVREERKWERDNEWLPHGSKVAKRPSALKTLTLQAAGAGISLLNSTPSKPNANI